MGTVLDVSVILASIWGNYHIGFRVQVPNDEVLGFRVIVIYCNYSASFG